MFALLLILLSAVFASPALAAFQASVDRNPVTEGDSFTLTLNSDESLDGEPDLSVLQKDFDVLGKNSGSSMQIINGSVTRSVQWQIQLMAKRSGTLIIPAIKAGDQSTTAIVLGVNKADQAKAGQEGGELFLEAIAEPRTAYVQQQIIFTVRLYRLVNIGNDSTLSDPKFPEMDAVVERLGEDHSYQTMRNGQAYAVIERRYAVYPQKSGNFSSAPMQFDGVIVDRNRRSGFMFDPFSQSTRQKRVFSKALSFTIKSAPESKDNAQWLPASKVTLSEQWSENPPKFTVGEPITRTLVISAQGLTASQLPALGSNAIDGFKLYPDQPVLNENKSDNGNTGVRTQKIAIMPTRTGTFMLPAIEVKWWNVNTDKMEVARLPAKTITVLPGSADANAAIPPPASTSGDVATQPVSNSAPLEIGKLVPVDRGISWWPWIALFLGIGWLLTLILLLRVRNKNPSVTAVNSNEEPLRKLESQFKQYCLTNDAAQAKSKLLAWAKLRWPNNPPTSLTAMAGLCEPALASALNELDRSLYAKDNVAWQGENLWQLFSRDKPGPGAEEMGEETSLKPLFLSSWSTR
ncbi:MAG: BatD family protein [Gallionella sp.]